jgi:signal peptidase I
MTPRRLGLCAVVALLAALAWVVLAPPTIGGKTSYVITRGTSMAPAFHTGDLALVRAQDSYRVGDVIAYRSPTLGVVVLHRIHSGNAHGFRTKGDNNSWVDPDAIPADQVIGKLWLHLPGVGTYMHAGTLIPGALLLGAAGVAAPVRKRMRHSGRSLHRRGLPLLGTAGRSTASAWWAAASVVGAVGALLVLVGVRAPAPAPATAAVVTHGLELTYQAPGDGAVYQGGTLVTGDPVYLALNPFIDVRVHDHATGIPAAPSRALSLQARLTGAGGWEYTVPLDGQATGAGTDHDLQVRLDLTALTDVIGRATSRTGSDGGDHQIQLEPALVPAARSARPVEFPPVVFQLQGRRLVLSSGEHQRGAPITRTATEPGRTVPGSPSTARQVHLAGLSGSASVVGVAGVAALVVAGLVAVVALLRRPRDPVSRLPQPLVTVSGRDLTHDTVGVASLDELFALARRYDRPVLRLLVRGRPTYVVEESGVWFSCAAAGEPGQDRETQRILLPGDRPRPPRPRASGSSHPSGAAR